MLSHQDIWIIVNRWGVEMRKTWLVNEFTGEAPCDLEAIGPLTLTSGIVLLGHAFGLASTRGATVL